MQRRLFSWRRLTGPLAAALLTVSWADMVRAEPVERVVHISVDGLNVAMLRRLLDDAPASVPGFGRLIAEGAYTFNARTDFDYTTTVPNHVSMYSGRPVLQPAGQADTVHHGMTSNGPGPTATIHSIGNPELGYVASVFDAVHDRGMGTGFFASKTRLAAFVERSYDGQNGAVDTIGADNGRDKIDDYFNLQDGSDAAVTAFVAAMDANPRTFSAVHIVDPDTAGHAMGWDSDAYRDSVIATDARIGRILDYVTSDIDFVGKTAVILTADHGGTAGNHTDPLDLGSYTIPTFLWGPGVPAGADFYSILTNRYDPGDTRPDFGEPLQPLRNGDTGNLALSLLGLSPVIGSSLFAELSLPGDEIPGDMDGSGTVDRADVALFVQRFGMADGAGASDGDFDGDGSASLADLAILQGNLSAVVGSPAAAPAAAVSEPAAGYLAGLGALALAAALSRERRRLA